jgi:hypothetical protein
MAKRFAEADLVIGIDRDGYVATIKSQGPDPVIATFVDGESNFSDVALIANEIKDAYAAQADPKDVHLAHAVVGLWLFYWINVDGTEISPTPIEMISHGATGRLRESAESFIAADFGRRATASRMADDGGADPAAS